MTEAFKHIRVHVDLRLVSEARMQGYEIDVVC